MARNELLRQRRLERKWRQREVAEKLGAALITYQRWERGEQEPGPFFRKQLCDLFGLSPRELGLREEPSFAEQPKSEAASALLASVASSMPAASEVSDAGQPAVALHGEEAQEQFSDSPKRELLWNIPFARNPFFTGRSQLLERLHKQLFSNKMTTLPSSLALSGLGGIGKTQIAIEYAYRYREEYSAVFWVRADSRDTLIIDFFAIAQLLALPVNRDQEPTQVVEMVKGRLQKEQGWLLILDNADDLSLLPDFLPLEGKGYLLLTTRAQATGKFARCVPVEKMEMSEGIRLVLLRAKLLEEDEPLETVSAAMRTDARKLVTELDGLPLALDQAGAYIEETGYDLPAYLALYRQDRAKLLKRESGIDRTYPYTVASTWMVSFSNVEQANPAAADLLRLCAFLHPDAIPEAILMGGAAILGPHLQKAAANPFLFNEAIGLLRRYSLVKRDGENKLLNMHRLVQAVLQDRMEEAERHIWAERAMLVVCAAFPEESVEEWVHYEHLRPHVLICAVWVEQEHIETLAASFLLDLAGSYLREQGQYPEAKRLLETAVSIRGQYPEAEDLFATSLSNLAGLLSYEGQYAEAEKLVQQARTIRERVLGAGHPDTAASLTHLAVLATLQRKPEQAEALYLQALSIYRQSLGPDSPSVAKTMSNLAVLYEDLGRYGEAEDLNRQALAIYRPRPELPSQLIARTLGNLGLICSKLGKYESAKDFCRQALDLQESGSLDASYSLVGLAETAREEREHELAEELYRQILKIRQQALEEDHPGRVEALEGLADVYREQKRYAGAQELYQQALSIWEQHFDSESLQMIRSLTGLAHLAREQGRYADAEQCYQHALHILERKMRSRHPDTAEALDGLAQLRASQGKADEAKLLYARVLAIREQALGADHPRTRETRHRLTGLLDALGPQENPL